MAESPSSTTSGILFNEKQEVELFECFTKDRSLPSQLFMFAVELMSLVMQENGQQIESFMKLKKSRKHSILTDAMKKQVSVAVQEQGPAVKEMVKKHCLMTLTNYDAFRAYANEITLDIEKMILNKKYFFCFSILLSIMCTFARKEGLLKAPRLGISLICRTRWNLRKFFTIWVREHLTEKANEESAEQTFNKNRSQMNEMLPIFGRIASESRKFETRAESKQLKPSTSSNNPIADTEIASTRSDSCESGSKINERSTAPDKKESEILKLLTIGKQPRQSTNSEYQMTEKRWISCSRNEPYGIGGGKKSEIFYCIYCGVSSHYKTTIEQHTISHEALLGVKANSPQFSDLSMATYCEKCGEWFKNFDSYWTHREVYCKEGTVSLSHVQSSNFIPLQPKNPRQPTKEEIKHLLSPETLKASIKLQQQLLSQSKQRQASHFQQREIQRQQRQANQFQQLEIQQQQASQFQQLEIQKQQASQFQQLEIPQQQASQFQQLEIQRQQASQFQQLEIQQQQASQFQQLEIQQQQAILQFQQLLPPHITTTTDETTTLNANSNFNQYFCDQEPTIQLTAELDLLLRSFSLDDFTDDIHF